MFTFNIPCTGAHRCQPNITLCNDGSYSWLSAHKAFSAQHYATASNISDHSCQPNIKLCNDSTVIHGWVHIRHSRHNIMPPLRILVTTAVSRISPCVMTAVIHGWVHMRHSRHNIMPPLRILVTTAVSRISPCVMTTVIHDGVHIRHSQHNTMPRFDYCRPPSNTVVQLCRKVGIFTAALCWTKRALWNGSHHDLLTLRESRHFSQRYVSKMIFTFLPPSDLDL